MNVEAYVRSLQLQPSVEPIPLTSSTPVPARPTMSNDPPNIEAASLVELILKDQRRLNRLLRNPTFGATLLTRLLGISLAGFVLFGIAMALVLSAAQRWPELTAISDWLKRPAGPLIVFEIVPSKWNVLAHWLHGDAFGLVAAYAFGLIAASGVCLPSLYFYCLLASVRMTMVEVVLHAVKSKAVAAMVLVGLLPIYMALAMGAVIFQVNETTLSHVLIIGLCLPFIAGFWGTLSLYSGFSEWATATPFACNAERECFLRRLVLSWSACYSAVMPVMIFTIWQALS